MRSRTSVINIPYDMKMVNNQPLYQIAEGHNKIRRPADPYDCMDDFIIIPFLVGDIKLLCDQFFYNISKILGEAFPCL